MNTVTHLQSLFLFNDWANRRVVFSLRDAPSERALKLLSHLLITEREYFERLYGKDSTGFDFWPTLTREECKELAADNAENYQRLLSKFEDEGLDLAVSYKTSEGVVYKNTYREMLTHVLFHSMSHRGQINTALRTDGFEPIANDYINYLRQN